MQILYHRGLTCQTSRGCRSSPQPSIIHRFDTFRTAQQFFKFLPQPVDLYRLIGIFGPVGKFVFLICTPVQVDRHLGSGMHKHVDLYRLTAIFGQAVIILPNLSQPKVFCCCLRFLFSPPLTKTINVVNVVNKHVFKFYG